MLSAEYVKAVVTHRGYATGTGNAIFSLLTFMYVYEHTIKQRVHFTCSAFSILVCALHRPRYFIDNQQNISLRGSEQPTSKYVCCILHSFSQPALYHRAVISSYY
jgi:hypothetical protein